MAGFESREQTMRYSTLDLRRLGRAVFVALVIFTVIICYRLERSRIGRAWMAIREDEIAAKAMGINTRNLKLLAFGMGATFGGISRAVSLSSSRAQRG